MSRPASLDLGFNMPMDFRMPGGSPFAQELRMPNELPQWNTHPEPGQPVNYPGYGNFGLTDRASTVSVDDPTIQPRDTTTASSGGPLNDASQYKDAFADPSKVKFSFSGDQNQGNSQANFILGEDGKLQVNPNNPPKPGQDVTVQVQAKNQEIAMKKIANDLQKQAINELAQYWLQNNPGKSMADIPEEWKSVLNQQPDLPENPNPEPTPQPEPQPEPQPPPQEDTQRTQQPEVQPPSDQSSGGNSGGSAGSDSSAGGSNNGGTSSGGSGGSDAMGGGSTGGSDGGGYSSGSSGGSSGGTDSAASVDPSTAGANVAADKWDNINTIVEVAKKNGIDPEVAVATSYVETGGTFDEKIDGDGGDSIGLFQLNINGEGAGMSVEERSNPEANAQIALSTMADYKSQANDYNGDGNISGGEVAASAQRPADQPGYAQQVDELVQNGTAKKLIVEAKQNADSGGGPPPRNIQGAPTELSTAMIDSRGDLKPQYRLDTGIDGSFSESMQTSNVVLGPGAAQEFKAAYREAKEAGVTIQVTSSFRDYQGQVNVDSGGNPKAAPGTSPHEKGYALDLANASDPTVEKIMNKHGFVRDVPNDEPHYTYQPGKNAVPSSYQA